MLVCGVKLLLLMWWMMFSGMVLVGVLKIVGLFMLFYVLVMLLLICFWNSVLY